MSAEAWVGVAAIAVTVALAIAGGLVAWMFGVYRKLGAIEQGFETLLAWVDELRKERVQIWDAHHALVHRVTRLERDTPPPTTH